MARNAHIQAIAARVSEIESWLDDEAPYARYDQDHLDSGTPERAYWHLGYVTALRDIVARLSDGAGDSEDSASHFPLADLDG